MKRCHTDFLHYAPELNQIFVADRKQKSYWKDAFDNNAKPHEKVKLVFIAKGDFGLMCNKCYR